MSLGLLTPITTLIASLAVLYIIHWLDIVEREPKKALITAFISGIFTAALALGFAEIASSTWLIATGSREWVNFAGSVIDAPIIEELCKLVGLAAVVAICRKNINSLMDLVLYGSAVAIGFEFIENTLYQWHALQSTDAAQAWIQEFNYRTIGTAGTHAFFSAWNGLAIWLVMSLKQSKVKKILCIVPILIAISLHSINNLSAFLANYGPAGELVQANYIGMLLGSINTSVSVAGFLALIGTALVLDLFSLSKLSIDLQKGLDNQRLEVLANPFYHLLAHASWSWKLAGETAAKEVQRKTFSQYARLAVEYHIPLTNKAGNTGEKKREILRCIISVI